jgi:signal peptidase I
MNTPQSTPPRNLYKFVKWGAASLFIVVLGLLAAVMLPPLVGGRTLVIISGSMEPAIPVGAAVVLRQVPVGDLQVGDVIAYTPASAGAIPIVHRIVDITERDGQRYFTMRGDANQSADNKAVTLPATAWRVWYNIPAAGYVINFASRPFGTFMFIIVPAVVLAALKLVEWRKSRRALQPQPARVR